MHRVCCFGRKDMSLWLWRRVSRAMKRFVASGFAFSGAQLYLYIKGQGERGARKAVLRSFFHLSLNIIYLYCGVPRNLCFDFFLHWIVV